VFRSLSACIAIPVEAADMNIVFRLLAVLCAVSFVSEGASWAQKPAAGATRQTESKPDDAPPDPRGRPDEEFIRVPQRYYAWHDAEGWHLRTAAQGNALRKFHGTIKLTGGTFNKLREIGLERKGKYADVSKVSADRTKIEFTIYTSSSFDGYDFTVKGDLDARVEFELHRGGRDFPREIFIGEAGKHPQSVKFSFPADPTGAE
jgi:hypothetical protein